MSKETLLRQKNELKGKLAAIQAELRGISDAERNTKQQVRNVEKQEREEKQAEKKRLSHERHAMAYRLRREGKTFSEIGVLLGGVSPSRARIIFAEEWRRRRKEQSRAGVPYEQQEPWDDTRRVPWEKPGQV